MAGQVSTSSLLQQLGPRLDKAVATHANDKTTYGMTRLPPGITNGIAKLIEISFGQVGAGKRNAGAWYMMMRASVIEPFEHTIPLNIPAVGGQKVKTFGLQTSQLHMLCDQKDDKGNVTTTLEQNVADALNAIRAVTSPTFTAKAKSGQDLVNLATNLNTACKQPGSKFYLRFSTSAKQDPKTKTLTADAWENWNGNQGLENYTPPPLQTTAAGAQGAANAALPAERMTTPARTTAATAATPAHAEEQIATGGEDNGTDGAMDNGEPAGVEPFDETNDIPGLVAKAQADDQAAKDELEQYALAKGYTAAEVEAAESWDEVGTWILGPGKGNENEGAAAADSEGDTAEGDEATETNPPQVRDVFLYKISTWDPKTKKVIKAKKASQCQVLTVDEENRTVTLQEIDTKQTVKSTEADPKKRKPLQISWDDLEEDS